MEEVNKNELGLSTKEALNKLCKDIESVLNQFTNSQKARYSINIIKFIQFDLFEIAGNPNLGYKMRFIILVNIQL